MATWSHDVSGAPHQLYQSTAGVQIPGLNVWVLMAVVATVWAILLSVACAGDRHRRRRVRGGRRRLGLSLTARQATGNPHAQAIRATGAHPGRDHDERTGVHAHRRHHRPEPLHAREPAAGGLRPDGHHLPRRGAPFEGIRLADPGLASTGDPVQDGRVLFFGYGCASCHGLQGQGGAVGKDLSRANSEEISTTSDKGPRRCRRLTPVGPLGLRSAEAHRLLEVS